jgi:hypothetical protein
MFYLILYLHSNLHILIHFNFWRNYEVSVDAEK